jgi:hypothetical protein
VTVPPRRENALRMPADVGQAAVLAALAALLIVGVLLFSGRFSFGTPQFSTNFYDLQARALLDGHWDIQPASDLGIEAFVIDDKAYTYFGPVPSLFRMPVEAVTDGFEGRLSQLSMLAALIVLAGALARLGWLARVTTLDESSAAEHHEAALVGIWVFAGLVASPVVYLVSSPIVYHEALLWGLALALWAYDTQARLMINPTAGRAALAVVLTTGAFLTRASVGLGPVVSLGLIGVWSFVRWFRSRRNADRPSDWNSDNWPWILGGSAVAAGTYAAVNLMRFGTLFRLPLDQQVFTQINGSRQEALAANGGSLFGVKFMPTTLWQYARPGNIRITEWFPFVDFAGPATVIGGAQFDTISRSASMTSTTPLLVGFAVCGAVVIIARRGRLISAYGFPIVGALAGTFATLAIAFIAHRYLGDLLPVVLLPASVAWWWIADRLANASTPVKLGGWALIAVIGVWSVMASFGVSLLNQQAYSATTPQQLGDFIALQQGLPGGDSPAKQLESTPDDSVIPQSQSLIIVGDCEALYWSDGERWVLAEAGASLRQDFTVTAADLFEPQSLVGRFDLWRTGDEIVVDGDGFRGVPLGVDDADDEIAVTVIEDPVTESLLLSIDGRPILSLGSGAAPAGRTDPAFQEVAGPGTPACQAALGNSSS